MTITKQIKEMPASQKRAGKAIALFFALMAAFAVLSRGLAAFTVARVVAATPSRGALTHEITLNGNVTLLGEKAFTLPEGFVVKELFLRLGSSVSAGEPVAVLELAHIERQLEQARRALEDARLAAAAKQVKTQPPELNTLEEAELKLERAKEDALAAVEAAKQNTTRALNELRQARQARRTLYDSGEYTDTELETAAHEIQMAELTVEEAELAEQKAATEDERAIADAQRAIEDATRENARQAKTNAEEAETRRLETERDRLTIAEKQIKIAELEALLAAEGKITAESDGLVTALNIKAGDITGAGGAYLLAGQKGGALFTASATKKEAALLAAKDRVSLTFAGLREPVSAEIAAIRSPEKAGDPYTVEVNLPGTDLPNGAPGTLEAVKRQGEGVLLPLSSLYSDGGEKRGYVFVLREKESTMGLVTTVERLELEILKRGESMAAVNAAFSPDDKIVTASTRPLKSGDRVKPEKPA